MVANAYKTSVSEKNRILSWSHYTPSLTSWTLFQQPHYSRTQANRVSTINPSWDFQISRQREKKLMQKITYWASLVAQWLRIRLPMQGTQVRALVREDPTYCRATKPASHNYWACVPQLLKPTRLEPVLHNKRSHHSEKPTHCNKDPMQPKI